MRIGVPKETAAGEHRVALVPEVVTKPPQIVVSISRKRARLIAAASAAEPSKVADDAATMRAMEAIARTLGIKTKGV